MTTTADGMLAHERLNKLFTPNRPIHLPEFLTGRLNLLHKTNDAVNTAGLHVVLFGARGIGKTSMARVLAHTTQEIDREEGRRSIFISCATNDDFASIWRKACQEILLGQRQIGLTQHDAAIITGRVDVGSALQNPNDVRIFFKSLPNPLVIVIDEFDRVMDHETKILMADTIKLFADTDLDATLILVGVAESIGELIAEHESIGRNLAQIPVELMTAEELAEIVQKGFAGAELNFEPGIDLRIAELSQGYPHYTHLLGLWSGRVAVTNGRCKVIASDLETAILRALENSASSIREEYDKAVDSSHPDNLFRQVLLACAQTYKDARGRFSTVDLREPMRNILGRSTVDTVSYQGHLAKFCEAQRGPVLKRTGSRRNYRWQFTNPQLIPYILMQGVNRGRLFE